MAQQETNIKLRRFTKIVCTLGPSSKTVDQIQQLVDAGMNVARINLSHGTREGHADVIRSLKAINAHSASTGGPCIAILLDTKGAEVRTGDVAAPIVVHAGEEVFFSYEPGSSADRKIIRVDHPGFADDAKRAECILLDNGEISFDLIEVHADGLVAARARESGSIGSRRHVNLPGARLTLPSFTDKDWQDIAFAVEQNVDFLALSFIREAGDVVLVRDFLAKKNSGIKIISKIETPEAVQNMRDILAVSDGIMIARGDLGAEMPFEKVPVIQDELVALCKDAGKPVIVATHMLESMIHSPMPTRAEVTDIAHAATTRTDATMLSGETASGLYPLAAVNAMDRVLRETELHIMRSFKMEKRQVASEREARAEAAVSLALSTNAAALIVMTRSGRTALDVCAFRPSIPILAFTNSEFVQHSLLLSFGILPLIVAFDADPEATVRGALSAAVRLGLLRKGNRVVLVSDTKAHELVVNTIQMRDVVQEKEE